MTQVSRFLLLIILSLSLFFELGLAKPNKAEADTSDLTVGLVLSGGGAKGIAHIGVLRVLEEAGVRVDFITGTSMGSVVGGLYAIGHTTEELTQLARSTDWEEMFTDRPSRRHLSMFEKEVDERFIASFPVSERGINLPPGLVAGQNIFMWMARHTWTVHEVENFSNFRIPYATVATDLETGDAVIFKEGFLPDAIRASIALPSLLTPYEIDGQILIDGGLIRNLPVIEALEMGADYIIAVDVSNPLRDAGELQSIPSILTQAVYFRVIEHLNQQKELADYVIDVSELDEFAVTDFDKTEQFLQIGEESTRKHFEKLQEIAVMQSQSITLPPANTGRQEIQINSVSVTGNDLIPGDFILNELGFNEGDFVTADLIEEAITRLYSTRLFNLITYRFMKPDNGIEGHHLRFRVIENTDDSFRVGVRYESETQASIRLHASFRNLLQRGSNLRFDLRLGRDTEFQTEYLYFGGIRSRFGLRTRLQYKGEQIDYYDGDSRISSLKNHLVSVDLFSGTFLSSTTLAGLGFRKDFIRFTREINTDLIPFSQRDYHAFYAKFLIDSMNRRSYPTRGHKLLLQSSLSDPVFLSPLSFNEQTFYWKAVYPISPNVSIQHTMHIGRTFGDDLPWHYWYSPNRRDETLGMTRFGGYDRYELTGRNIQLFSTGLQFEVARHRFIRMDAYLGNVFNEFQFNPLDNRYRTGYSLSAGVLTILGPIEAIFSTSPRNPFLFELQIGYEF